MRGGGWMWFAALAVTLLAAVWQRMSGPTYPVRGQLSVGASTVRIRLPRSGETGSALPIRVHVPAASVSGAVAWRRYPTTEAWRVVPLAREGEALVASLPPQPPAGKVEYQVRLRAGDGHDAVFPPRPAVARFKGHVSPLVLVPHVLFMFTGMLLANRTGLEALVLRPRIRRLAWATLGTIGVGGLLLGPAVQKAAFGAWWTGFPYGIDLTDNKTAIAALFWAFAVWRLRRRGAGRVAVGVAALVTLAVFSIPHSTWGSEIRWEEGGVTSNAPAALPEGAGRQP